MVNTTNACFEMNAVAFLLHLLAAFDANLHAVSILRSLVDHPPNVDIRSFKLERALFRLRLWTGPARTGPARNATPSAVVWLCDKSDNG